MSEDIKNCPRLRFPRFKGPWVSAPLDSISTISSGLTNEQVDYITPYKISRIETISSGSIDINKIGYIEYSNNISSSKLNVGDILFSNINSISHIGKSAYISSEINLYHGINLLRIVTDNTIYSKFVFYIINTYSYRDFFRQRANKAVNKASINQTELGKTVIKYPQQYKEQKKIADFFSSLDELIEVHEQKLDVLKQHKKGLMQRLFPAEGETTPRWRFPEFRNNGEWQNISVSQLGKVITGKTPSTTNLSFWNGEYIWVTPTDITHHKDIYSSNRTITSLWIKNNVLPVNTVLITCIASIGKNCILQKEGFCNQQINAIVPNLKNYNSNFIYYNFEKNEHILINNSGASATRILAKSKFEKLHFLFPSLPEQQKIANCLTSLDERIEAQEEKITALKERKKGLMQQLFPSL